MSRINTIKEPKPFSQQIGAIKKLGEMVSFSQEPTASYQKCQYLQQFVTLGQITRSPGGVESLT